METMSLERTWRPELKQSRVSTMELVGVGGKQKVCATQRSYAAEFQY